MNKPPRAKAHGVLLLCDLLRKSEGFAPSEINSVVLSEVAIKKSNLENRV